MGGNNSYQCILVSRINKNSGVVSDNRLEYEAVSEHTFVAVDEFAAVEIDRHLNLFFWLGISGASRDS